MRTSTRTGVVSPSRVKMPSCKTRSSLPCNSIGIWLISSRNSVPPSANSNLPICPPRRAPVKAPLLVAEQFGLDQFARHGGAIQRHERPAAAVAGIVDALGQQLLARSGLALDQHAGATVCHSFSQIDHARQGRVFADDVHPACKARQSSNWCALVFGCDSRRPRLRIAPFEMIAVFFADHMGLHDEAVAGAPSNSQTASKLVSFIAPLTTSAMRGLDRTEPILRPLSCPSSQPSKASATLFT